VGPFGGVGRHRLRGELVFLTAYIVKNGLGYAKPLDLTIVRLYNERTRRDGMLITEHANGFISVDDFYVQGAQAFITPRIADANDSRPSCTCNFYHVKNLPKGFCPHINAALSFLRAKKRG
jgi:hypothetical protein